MVAMTFKVFPLIVLTVSVLILGIDTKQTKKTKTRKNEIARKQNGVHVLVRTKRGTALSPSGTNIFSVSIYSTLHVF